MSTISIVPAMRSQCLADDRLGHLGVITGRHTPAALTQRQVAASWIIRLRVSSASFIRAHAENDRSQRPSA